MVDWLDKEPQNPGMINYLIHTNKKYAHHD